MAVSERIPEKPGRFGGYGGRFVPELLMPALLELEEAYERTRTDPDFDHRLSTLLKEYVGRPTPLYFAEGLTEKCGGARIWLKREDLCHTGSHKLNNALAQALLAKGMGKGKVIAETGAGQHGVATATAAAVFGLGCRIFMGREDIRRQSPNVFRMKMLGAEVIPVDSGSKTLKDACNEALRFWASHVSDTHYIIGSVVGPHPFPTMVRDFQSIIGTECRSQILESSGKLPDSVVACVGGGSNSMGIFQGFLGDTGVRLIGVEAGGLGLETGKHAASLTLGIPGVLHGAFTPLLQDADGQILEAHSISAGLDYPGVGPEHAYLRDIKRAEYTSVTDNEALGGFRLLCRTEGIIPALESSHALAYAAGLARDLGPEAQVVVCLSGRGDKDVQLIAELGGDE